MVVEGFAQMCPKQGLLMHTFDPTLQKFHSAAYVYVFQHVRSDSYRHPSGTFSIAEIMYMILVSFYFILTLSEVVMKVVDYTYLIS